MEVAEPEGCRYAKDASSDYGDVALQCRSRLTAGKNKGCFNLAVTVSRRSSDACRSSLRPSLGQARTRVRRWLPSEVGPRTLELLHSPYLGGGNKRTSRWTRLPSYRQQSSVCGLPQLTRGRWRPAAGREALGGEFAGTLACIHPPILGFRLSILRG